MAEVRLVKRLIVKDQKLKGLIFNISFALRKDLRNIFTKEEHERISHLRNLLIALKKTREFSAFLRMHHNYEDLVRLVGLLDETQVHEKNLHEWWDKTYQLLNKIESDLEIDIEEIQKNLTVNLRTTYFNIFTLEEDELQIRNIIKYIDDVYLVLIRFLKAKVDVPINVYITSDKERLAGIVKKFNKGKLDSYTTVNFRANSIFVLLNKSQQKNLLGPIFHVAAHLFADMRLKKGYGSKLFGHESICHFFQVFGEDIILHGRLNYHKINPNFIRGVPWKDLGEHFYHKDIEKHNKVAMTTLSVYATVFYKYGEYSFVKFLDYFFDNPHASIFDALTCVEDNPTRFYDLWDKFFRIR